jgi:hypothetical protein
LHPSIPSFSTSETHTPFLGGEKSTRATFSARLPERDTVRIGLGGYFVLMKESDKRDLFDAEIQLLGVGECGKRIQIALQWIEEVIAWWQSPDQHFREAFHSLKLWRILKVGISFQQLTPHCCLDECSTSAMQISTSKKK